MTWDGIIILLCLVYWMLLTWKENLETGVSWILWLFLFLFGVYMSYFYVGSPYTDDNHEVMEERYELVAEFVARELNEGVSVYSPIVHCHEIAKTHVLPRDFEFWKKYNFDMLQRASGLIVLMLSGWDMSRGLTAEINFADGNDIPIKFRRLGHRVPS